VHQAKHAGCLRVGLTVLGNADLSLGLGVKGSRLGGRQLRLTPGVSSSAPGPVYAQREEKNLNERTSDPEDDDKQGSQAKDEDSAASSADRAKEREREMEESGEENAA
jgi:hypothetical protein